jgi:hypothetical protein
MAQSNSRKEKSGKRGVRGRGDEVFPPSTELVVERARRERRRPGLFIGRCPNGEIFLVPILIHHVVITLTSSSHIAMAGACSCAHWSCLGGYSGGSARR